MWTSMIQPQLQNRRKAFGSDRAREHLSFTVRALNFSWYYFASHILTPRKSIPYIRPSLPWSRLSFRLGLKSFDLTTGESILLPLWGLSRLLMILFFIGRVLTPMRTALLLSASPVTLLMSPGPYAFSHLFQVLSRLSMSILLSMLLISNPPVYFIKLLLGTL